MAMLTLNTPLLPACAFELVTKASGLCFTEVSCSSLSVANAYLNTTASIYRTYVKVSCQTGYQFAEDEFWMVTQCQGDKTWSTQPADCTGEYFLTLLPKWPYSLISQQS